MHKLLLTLLLLTLSFSLLAKEDNYNDKVQGLINLLSKEENFVMPPTGKKNWANELTVKVITQATVSEIDHLDLFENERAVIMKEWRDYYGSDTHISSNANTGNGKLLAYLKSITKKEIHADLEIIFKQFNWYQTNYMLIYDIGAEIVADELLVLTPDLWSSNTKQTIIIHLSYVQS